MIGGMAVLLVFQYRGKRVELAREAFQASKEETDAIAAAERVKKDADVAALTGIIEDLREEVDRQSQRYSRLQTTVTDKWEAAGQERDELRNQLHECEKRHAVLEFQQKETAADVVRLTEEIKALKGKP